MKKAGFGIFVAIVAILGFIVAAKINYPPTQEQLRILRIFSIRGDNYLWILRLISLVLAMVGMEIWTRLSRSMLAPVFLVISPTFMVLWWLYPLQVAKLTLLLGLLHLGIKKLRNIWIVGVALSVMVIWYNCMVIGNKPAIFNKFSLVDAQNEVTARITNEDKLLQKIKIPLALRRVSYNKFYFVYKQAVAEALPFWDFESIFFQEINPTEQKSIVIFFWPEVILLILGIWAVSNRNNKPVIELILLTTVIAWINYIFSEGPSYLRLMLVMLPISVLLVEGAKLLINLMSKRYILAGWFGGILGILICLGFGINLVELMARVQYWLDNRPLAYQFWFTNLKQQQIDEANKVQVTTLIGSSESYCWYYLGSQCQSSKFVFSNFNLEKEVASPKTVYAGFAGEFVGSKFKNDISSNWQDTAESGGLRMAKTMSLRDTIANQFGNDIGLAIKD